jgi:hypothetical protein
LLQCSPDKLSPLEVDPQRHVVCAIEGALRLIAGEPVQVSMRAYPCTAPGKTERLLQVFHGVAGVLTTTGRNRSLVSGEQLAYRNGRIDYFADHLISHWRAFGKIDRPFFVVPGGEPVKSISAITGCDPAPVPQLYISDIHCTVVVMANWQGYPAVIHYGECDDAVDDIVKRAAGYALVFQDGRFAPFLARTFSFRKLADGSAIIAQSRIESDPYEFSWSKVDRATEFWLTREVPRERQGFYQIDSRLSDLRQFFPAYIDSITPMMDVFREWCELARLPADLSHGDFWLGNVLFKGDRIVGIIDWEWPRRNGLPLLDALYMLLNSTARKYQVTLPFYLRQLWADEVEDHDLAVRLESLCTQSGMDRDDLKFIGLALWFETLWKVGSSGWVNLDLWFNDSFHLTIPVIQTWLESRSGDNPHRIVSAAMSAR